MGRTKGKLPYICLDADHARRLRNLWLHNNGLLNELYGTDGIHVDGHSPIVIPAYQQWLNDKRPRAVYIGPGSFEKISLSHITLLHHVHDAVQRVYFGETRGYSYKGEKKRIRKHVRTLYFCFSFISNIFFNRSASHFSLQFKQFQICHLLNSLPSISSSFITTFGNDEPKTYNPYFPT